MQATSENIVRPTIPAFSVFLAATFFSAAITPSMMPRTPLTLGVIAGVAAAVGFEVGNLIRWLWLFLELPRALGRWKVVLEIFLFAAAIVITLVSLSLADDWQNATRSAVKLAPLTSSDPVTIILLAVVTFFVVWAFFRLFGITLRLVNRGLSKFLPRRVGLALGFVLVAWLFWALLDGVLGGLVLQGADQTFKAADRLIDPRVPQPASADKVGSEASLVDWETLGKWGRVYINQTPSKEEIAEFSNEPAMEPVRVYVGLRSAPTPQARAKLALQELIRVSGFERSNLVIVTPTGTGWMDPGAHDTLDYMLAGDVATVVVQYSYLPSALALFADPSLGVEQATALFDTIYAYWTTLPKDNRPRLYLYGLSLGAFSSQESLPLLDLLGDPIQGALWAGSPFFSPVWQEVVRARHVDSPVWRPLFGNGSLVRTMNQDGVAAADYADWGPTRLIFLTFGSDPIASFTFETAYRPPEWLEDRPPDVSPDLDWFPIVTMLQVAMDTGFSMTVPSYGHYYSAPEYIDAWAELVDPPGWSEEQADDLKAIFAARPPTM